MKKKYLLVILLLCSVTAIFSQITVSGIVKDSINNPLPYANVQVLDSLGARFYKFSTTKSNGEYSIELKKKGSYLFKVTYLGYSEEKKIVAIDKFQNLIDFTLNPKTNDLKEVIIKYDPRLAKVTKDTIVYDLSRIQNGQESTLKDVLQKLPGIDINAQGKVTAFGTKVGKLLIDGEDLFKEQHQLATENITADMIAGITFFRKYQGFANIDGFNNDTTTAVNISIKDKYKQRITGNLKAHNGILNKYLVHTNLFKFGKKLKLTLLGDANNLGKESISFDDYISLNTTVSFTSFGKSRSYDDSDMPIFLRSTRDIANREIGFGALNFVYSPSKNLKISGYSIFNSTNQSQVFINNRFFFQDIPNQKENRNILGDFIFNTTQAKLAYKSAKHTFIQYTITNSPEKDTEKLDLSNNFNNTSNIFDQQIKNNNQNLGQELKITSKINDNSLLEFNSYTQYKESKKDISIFSNNPFLGFDFLNKNFELNQQNKTLTRVYGYNITQKNKLKIGTLDFGTGLIHKNRNLFTFLKEGDTPNSVNDLSLKLTDSYISGTYKSKRIGIFSYSLGLEYHHLFYNLNDNEKNNRNVLFPNLGIDFRFNQKLSVSLNYAYTNKYPWLSSVIKNDVVFNYLNKQVNNPLLNFNEILPTHRLGSLISWTDFKSGNSILLSIQYTNKSKALTQNLNYQPDNFTENKYQYTDINQNMFGTFDFDKNFKKTKLKFTSNTLSIIDKSGSFIDGNENISDSFLLEQAFRLSTNNKKAININAGVELLYYLVENSINNSKFKSTAVNPYGGIKISLLEKKITCDLKIINNNLKAGNISRSFTSFSPSIKYAKPKSHWEFSLTGNNILNLESPEIVDNVNNNVYFEQRISRSLEGYLIFGTNYKF